MRFPLILISIHLSLLWLTTVAVAVSVSLSKPGCPEKCGNVTIPYPFGIGSSCSANSSYTVICKNSSIPILSSINMEALNFSLDSRMVKVKQPVFPLVCSSTVKKQSLGKSLLGSPFTISKTENSLVVSGCQNSFWWHVDETTMIGGCIPNSDVNFTVASCNGAKFCQIAIPEGLQEVEFTHQSIVEINNNGSNICGHVFLKERRWFQEDYEMDKDKNRPHNLLNLYGEEFRFATVVLEWKLNDPNHSPLASSGCVSKDSENDLIHPTPTKCTCKYGYEGNPYLPEGCRDIDECNSNSTLNACGIGIPCINLNGSYTCDYPAFKYPHDNQCRIEKAFIFVSGRFMALLLLIGVLKLMRSIFGFSDPCYKLVIFGWILMSGNKLRKMNTMNYARYSNICAPT